jgi:hypothetical protein
MREVVRVRGKRASQLKGERRLPHHTCRSSSGGRERSPRAPKLLDARAATLDQESQHDQEQHTGYKPNYEYVFHF